MDTPERLQRTTQELTTAELRVEQIMANAQTAGRLRRIVHRVMAWAAVGDALDAAKNFNDAAYQHHTATAEHPVIAPVD